ncbi:hypothetical protein BJY01DRAFT_218958 [Aspergillus pseudoustus]|uniref:Secreted protein n=1 Tax=Aspergillus pseudoustus TaxID=1810923 RepID=A0ABR4JIR2_9EURO
MLVQSMRSDAFFTCLVEIPTWRACNHINLARLTLLASIAVAPVSACTPTYYSSSTSFSGFPSQTSPNGSALDKLLRCLQVWPSMLRSQHVTDTAMAPASD